MDITQLFIHLLKDVLCVSMCVKSLQSCPTLCDSMDYSLPGSSVHGTPQERILGCHALLQGIFPTQGLNPCILCLLHWQVGFLFFVFYHKDHLGSS